MPKRSGKTLATLAAAHDQTVVVPNRIRAALAALAAAGDDWAYESDFMALAKPPISAVLISRYRDQFAEFWAEMPTTNGRGSMKRVWFATAKLARAWKEQINA